MEEIVKVKPIADALYSYGNDGRDAHYYVQYSCPKCKKKISYKDIACDRCGTFFKWNQRARITMLPYIVWE